MKVRARQLYGRTYFTEGATQEFEREMQITPGFTKLPRTQKERDCPHCLYWDEKKKRCKENTCIVFEH